MPLPLLNDWPPRCMTVASFALTIAKETPRPGRTSNTCKWVTIGAVLGVIANAGQQVSS